MKTEWLKLLGAQLEGVNKTLKELRELDVDVLVIHVEGKLKARIELRSIIEDGNVKAVNREAE